MTSFIKTVYVCPTEGLVPKEVSHTHTYKVRVETDGNIILQIRNDGYICEGTEYYIYHTSKAALIKKVAESKELTERLIGDIRKLVEEMPDEFVETIAYILGYDDKTLTQAFKDVRIKITDLESDLEAPTGLAVFITALENISMIRLKWLSGLNMHSGALMCFT